LPRGGADGRRPAFCAGGDLAPNAAGAPFTVDPPIRAILSSAC